jgi:glycosidase
LRRSDAALREGTNQMLDYDSDHLLVWLRKTPGRTVVVECNLDTTARTLTPPPGKLVTIVRSDSSATAASLPPRAVYIGAVE